MKIARFFAAVFAAVGTVVMAGAVLLCLLSIDAPVRMEQVPQGAAQCAQELEAAFAAKDYEALESLIYGQPELGMTHSSADPLQALLWEKFLGSLSFSYTGDYYVSGSRICRDATVTSMDVTSATANLKTHARNIMNSRVAAATEMSELYDEENNFRADLVEQVLREAMEQALQQDALAVGRNVTVEFVFADGKWWAVPDAALLDALSGGLD